MQLVAAAAGAALWLVRRPNGGRGLSLALRVRRGLRLWLCNGWGCGGHRHAAAQAGPHGHGAHAQVPRQLRSAARRRVQLRGGGEV